ncbi:MAG: NAAT family transporter [bacterium]|nr:NAAT family transporter [bacterium]
MLEWHQYLEILTAILVIVDPFGAIPIFISITSDESPRQRANTARIASITLAVVLIGAAFAGEPLLKLLGIRLASFQVGGGILILLLSLSMINAKVSPTKQTPEEEIEAVAKENVAVVPLAVPLLAGPAAISTVIVFAHRSEDWSAKGFVIFSVILVALLTWILLRLSIPLSHKLGRIGINTFTRAMGMVLSAIAIEFIATGLLQLFPGLG